MERGSSVLSLSLLPPCQAKSANNNEKEKQQQQDTTKSTPNTIIEFFRGTGRTAPLPLATVP